MFDSNKPNSNWISSSRVCQCHHTKVLLLWCLFFFLFSDDSFSFLNIVHHMYPNMYQICLIILGIPLSLSLSLALLFLFVCWYLCLLLCINYEGNQIYRLLIFLILVVFFRREKAVNYLMKPLGFMEENFEESIICFDAKETCNNWFHKDGTIWELLPCMWGPNLLIYSHNLSILI